MYPIAWAVIDNESKESWSWFIQNLISDLGLGLGDGLTVISDMQKGLVQSILKLLPNCEQRMCARHIWSNWQKTWKGEERRKQFWRCFKASFEVKLKEELDKLGKLGEDICEDLLKYNKEHWCRAFFREHAKCDVVENNMCETFNSWILAARHKSIITMLEEIRHKVMTRHVDMLKFSETWITNISPMARLVLEENKEKSRKCIVMWNGAHDGFEIEEYGYRFIVKLSRRTCTYRSWQLRGIPCQHAICAFCHLEQEPYHLVDYWYSKETFQKAYVYFLEPIPNMKMWPETNNMKIEPPAPKVMPGRPKKKRRKDRDEVKRKYGKLSKKGDKMTCSICHQASHNKNGCPARSGIGEFSSSQSTRATQATPSSQTRQEPSVNVGNQDADVANAGRARGRRTTIRVGKGAFPNAPPPTTHRMRYVGLKKGRGRESVESSSRQKRQKDIGFGCYINPTTGRTVINPGSSSERVVSHGRVMKDTSAVNTIFFIVFIIFILVFIVFILSIDSKNS